MADSFLHNSELDSFSLQGVENKSTLAAEAPAWEPQGSNYSKRSLTPSAAEFKPKGMISQGSFMSESDSMFSMHDLNHNNSFQSQTNQQQFQNNMGLNAFPGGQGNTIARNMLQQQQLRSQQDLYNRFSPNLMQMQNLQNQVGGVNPIQSAQNMNQANSSVNLNVPVPLPAFIGAPPLKSNNCKMIPRRKTWDNFYFLPDELKSYFAMQNALLLEEVKTNGTASANSTSILNDLLNEVPKDFHCINLLDHPGKKRGAVGSTGFSTSVFKVVSATDGFAYCLRRVDNVRVSGLQQLCGDALRLWNRLKHPNVITLRDCFVRRNALFLLHDYIPGAKTVNEFIQSRSQTDYLKEDQLWSIVVQLLTGLQAVHSRGIACRGIDLNRILISARLRCRLGSVGLAHVLFPTAESSMGQGPQQMSNLVKAQMSVDLTNIGRVLLSLAAMNVSAFENIESAVQLVKSNYSPGLVQFLGLIFSGKTNIDQALGFVSPKFMYHVDEIYSHADSLEEYLSKQMESERLFKLLMKLSFVVNRPELDQENRDLLVIRLFYDYIFHQVNDKKEPVFDLDFVFMNLNKLDLGVSEEKILLTTKGHETILIMSFLEIKNCIESVFNMLMPNSGTIVGQTGKKMQQNLVGGSKKKQHFSQMPQGFPGQAF